MIRKDVPFVPVLTPRESRSFVMNTERHSTWMRNNPTHPAVLDTVGIIAAGPDGASHPRHYFDARGVVRVYTMSFRDGIWTLVRDVPDFTPLEFAQRFTGRFADDGSAIDGAWETASDGV